MLTRPGRRAYPRAPAAEWAGDGEGRRPYLFGEPDEVIQEADASLGIDIGAVRAGHVSVTQLAFAVGLGDLSPGLRAFIARLTETFPPVIRPGRGARSLPWAVTRVMTRVLAHDLRAAHGG